METAEALALAREIARSWDWATDVVEPEPNRLDIYLHHPGDLVAIVTALRVKRLGYLTAITGLDLGATEGALEVLYHFCAAAAVITVRARVARDNATIPTLTDLIPSAEPFERELSEMFGVRIAGLFVPEHLYLPDGWPDNTYPLRKEFDVSTLASTDGSQQGV